MSVDPSTQDAAKVAAYEPSDPESWHLGTSYRMLRSFVTGEVLADLGDTDERIAVLTADLKFSNRTADFERRHPERFVNAGISEQNMVTMAAGMATFGFIPYVSTFASFVGLLAAEQIRTDLAYPRLPVRVIAHHAGIALGFYGTSHHATEDLAITRSIADLTVIGPCDGPSLGRALRTTVEDPGPIYFRISRGRDPDVYPADGEGFEVGRAAVLREGGDLLIVANGVTVAPALAAAEQLAAAGIEAAVVDCHTLKPFDAETICRLAAQSGRVLVSEEHNTIGGVATACADAFVEHGVGVRLERLGIPDEYAPIGPPTRLYQHYKLDAAGIAATARGLVEG